MSHSIPRFLLGSYEPLLELASGGMATVYVARQIGAAGFERLVVLKRVHPHLLPDREFTDMFRDEARLASLIRHPNVVSVIDVVESDRELFLVMDYVESTAVSTLNKSLKRAATRLPPAVAGRIVADTLMALQAAHEAVDMRGVRLDVVHRDVSPQNIIVGVDGTARLIDFGIAKAHFRLTETRSGSLKGKLGYMSPEGAHGRPVDRRADVFSTGVVLFELLTGTRLFHGQNDLDSLRLIAEAHVPSAREMIPDLPVGIDAVLDRALAREPDQRFSSALEFLTALEQVLPLAAPREVASVVERFCGHHLADRRAQLRLRLEGKVESVNLMRRGLDGSNSLYTPASAVTTDGGSPGTENRMATSRDLGGRAQRGKVWPIAIASFVLVGVAIAAVGIYMRRAPEGEHAAAGPAASAAPAANSRASLRSDAPAAAPTPKETASAESSSPPPSSTAPPSNDVELVVTADGPIESVRTKGLRRIDLDGARARIVVAPWSGELEIECILADGSAQKAVASADGSREIAAQPAAKKARPRRAPAAAPARPKDELHENPYTK